MLEMSRHGAMCGDLSAQPSIRELPNRRGKFYFLARDLAYSSAYGPKKTTGYFSHGEEIVHMLQLQELPYTPSDLTEQFREKCVFWSSKGVAKSSPCDRVDVIANISQAFSVWFRICQWCKKKKKKKDAQVTSGVCHSSITTWTTMLYSFTFWHS